MSRRFTPEEIKKLTKLHKQGVLPAEIAKKMGREEQVIRAKLVKMGLLDVLPKKQPKHSERWDSSQTPLGMGNHTYNLDRYERNMTGLGAMRVDQCSWIFGDVPAGTACRCTEDARRGSSYCEKHHNMTHVAQGKSSG